MLLRTTRCFAVLYCTRLVQSKNGVFGDMNISLFSLIVTYCTVPYMFGFKDIHWANAGLLSFGIPRNTQIDASQRASPTGINKLVSVCYDLLSGVVLNFVC